MEGTGLPSLSTIKPPKAIACGRTMVIEASSVTLTFVMETGAKALSGGGEARIETALLMYTVMLKLPLLSDVVHFSK